MPMNLAQDDITRFKLRSVYRGDSAKLAGGDPAFHRIASGTAGDCLASLQALDMMLSPTH